MFTDPTIYTPRSAEHQRLISTFEGKENTTSSDEQMGADLLKEYKLEDLIFELYEIIRNDTGRWQAYMQVHEPELVNDMWTMRRTLTPVGQKALDSLNVGWHWNHDILDVDVTSTVDFYDQCLRRGNISIDDAEQLVGNTDERLREIRNRLVYFKMTAAKSGNFLRGTKVA